MSTQETANITSAEMEETIARISSHKGVEGVMIMNKEGESMQCTKQILLLRLGYQLSLLLLIGIISITKILHVYRKHKIV